MRISQVNVEGYAALAPMAGAADMAQLLRAVIAGQQLHPCSRCASAMISRTSAALPSM